VTSSNLRVSALATSVYTIPTEKPESDGTLTWSSTTVVVVEVTAGASRGLGFTYATPACARLIEDLLRDVVLGSDPFDVKGTWSSMVRAIRNMGRPGISSMAIAAVDTALWDLKAKLLDMSLASLLGRVREDVPVYGSGGFTSLSDDELEAKLSQWVYVQGFSQVKIKIGESWGTCIDRDLERINFARAIIGDQCELFVDANGAYSSKQAIRVAANFAECQVSWFEEPVSSDHLSVLAEIRSLVTPDVAAGEYGYDLFYFESMLAAGAVDCLQADVSRCAGITEWLRVAALAEAHGLEISGHCAPSLHVHPAASVPNLRHLEYFYDHARVDRLLFDGVLDPSGGVLRPDLTAAGMGLTLKASDAERYRVA
jgi:L-alanine-DL-glutamate epimerase-like enolase superfamily enzyme